MKSIKSSIIKIVIKVKERKYKKRLKYLFFKGRKSNKLIIVFSGFSPDGKACYNYVKTLAGVKDNKLFLSDDFCNNGSYYLGENGSCFLLDWIHDLIADIKKKYSISEIICCGSSKGGGGSLIHGLYNNVDKIIVGAPQYFIGAYLNDDEHRSCLEKLLKHVDDESINELDGFIRKLIYAKQGTDKPDIYLHYSVNDHTYNEHIQFLIRDLEANGYSIIKDEQTYAKHSDVGIYFKKFLLNSITE